MQWLQQAMNIQTYFRQRRAVITGGSSGIGLSLARCFASLGCEVVLVARRVAMLEQAKKDILQLYPNATVDVLSLDVSDEEAVEKTMQVYTTERTVDFLVNNAGVVMPGRFVDLPNKEFKR